MSGIAELNVLLASLSPVLGEDEYVYCSVATDAATVDRLQPLATFRETEGLSLIVPRRVAEQQGLPFDGVFRLISLTVHSSLEAVGLTAAVATALAAEGISANVIAAHFHDHILVPATQAERALAVLESLAVESGDSPSD